MKYAILKGRSVIVKSDPEWRSAAVVVMGPIVGGA